MIPRTTTGASFTRASRRLRILGLATLAALAPAVAGGSSVHAADGPRIAPEQELVNLHSIKDVRARPQVDTPTLVGVADQRPITLVRTSLPVLGRATDDMGREWLRVRLPGRVFDRKTPPPTGWITADGTQRSSTAWHLVVDLRTRRVLAYRDGRLARAFQAIVGKPSTPTPRGEYFIEETMRFSSRQLLAPGALATSARSPVFREFMGGPGQIALHGIANVGGKLGTATSNGCVRMTTTAIKWLRKRIRAGVPLTIR